MLDKKKLSIALALLFVTNIILVLVMTTLPDARAETFRQGSTGETVRQIQTKLKNWGYYTGAVDGVYGTKTTEAVRYFQSKNGLTADGLCGIRTQQAMGIFLSSASSGSAQRQSDLELLARLISAESRGEPYNGQVAVGAVVLNRVRHPSFPASLSGVIYQPGAFSSVSDGQFNQPVADISLRAARDAMNGVDPSYGSIYFFNPAKTANAWIWSRPVSITIGAHRFCK